MLVSCDLATLLYRTDLKDTLTKIVNIKDVTESDSLKQNKKKRRKKKQLKYPSIGDKVQNVYIMGNRILEYQGYNSIFCMELQNNHNDGCINKTEKVGLLCHLSEDVQ